MICRECWSSDIQVTSDKGPKPGEFHGILGRLLVERGAKI